MKRTIVAVLLALVATTVSAQERHRYAVALKHPVLAHPTPEFVGIDVEMSTRNYEPLQNLQAYVADLTEAEAAAIRKQPGVRFVEASMVYHKLDIGGAPGVVDASRNLNGQTLPYGIDLVHARDAWPVVRGLGVNVAIVDTGIDYNHPDLRGNYKGGFNEINNTTDPLDDDSHGSHVAGTVAATDNDLGVVGVAPLANIWAVKVLDNTGSGTTTNIAAGLNWVIDKKKEIGGNWIVNMSLGDSHFSDIMQVACQKVSDAGILIVAASGNESTATVPAAVAYPAALPTVMAVGAIDSTSTIADFSNQGPQLAIVGPGVNVLSSVPRGAGELSFVSQGTSSFDAIHIEGSPKDTITSGFVFCGHGDVGEFPASVSGKIALIQRGGDNASGVALTFNAKAKNAKAAGAIAVLIFNNEKPFSPFTFIGSDPMDKTFAWPLAVGITAEDGAVIKANPNATITIAYKNDDYAIFSGTSMATPHVVGVAALIWSAAPNATAAQVRLALTSSAHDLGATGNDLVYGSGLVNAIEAGKLLAPEKFGSSTQPPDTVPHGRRILHR